MRSDYAKQSRSFLLGFKYLHDAARQNDLVSIIHHRRVIPVAVNAVGEQLLALRLGQQFHEVSSGWATNFEGAPQPIAATAAIGRATNNAGRRRRNAPLSPPRLTPDKADRDSGRRRTGSGRGWKRWRLRHGPDEILRHATGGQRKHRDRPETRGLGAGHLARDRFPIPREMS